MTEIVDIQQADDPRDTIHRAVQHLANGELVALPTETAYVVGASAVSPAGIERLRAAINGSQLRPFALALPGPQAALDYVPEMSHLGRRLTRRCWPGPLTLEFPVADGNGLLQALPEAARETVLVEGLLRLRVSAQRVLANLLRLVPAPVVLSADSAPGDTPARQVQDLAEDLRSRVSLMIDDGTCRYEQPSTVVRVDNEEWQVVQPGIITDSIVARMAAKVYLFVCTGNTCRSPMAEALFRKLLADRLQCEEDELAERGFVVASAGLAAATGAPASLHSVEVLEQKGIGLQTHASQPLSNQLLNQTDHVYTMTEGHRNAILADRPDLADRVRLLSPEGFDVSDPIGGGIDDYVRCRDEIERHIRALVDQIRGT